MSVLRILWRHKLIAMPFIALTIALFAGALFFGPRAYQATSSFAMITPALPSPVEVENSPALSAAADNPYLRSADPTLVLQVGKTRLSSEEVTKTLQTEGLSTEFTVGTGLATSTQILNITADATSPDIAVQSARRLGEILDQQIRDVQLVNGASDRYLITVQTINEATGATERVSSRLRNAAVAGIAGVVLLIGAVATARAFDERKIRKLDKGTRPVVSAPEVPPTPQLIHPHNTPPLVQPRSSAPQRPLPPQRPVGGPRTGPVRVAPARPLAATPVRRVVPGSTPPSGSHPQKTTGHSIPGSPGQRDSGPRTTPTPPGRTENSTTERPAPVAQGSRDGETR